MANISLKKAEALYETMAIEDLAAEYEKRQRLAKEAADIAEASKAVFSRRIVEVVGFGEKVVGENWEAVVSKFPRTSVSWKAVAEDLGATKADAERHSTTTEVERLSFTAHFAEAKEAERKVARSVK